MQLLRNTLRAAGEFIYPPHCALCRRPMESLQGCENSGISFCSGCRDALVPEYADSCQRCGAPLGPHLDPQDDCGYCRGTRFAFQSVTRLGIYENEMQQACVRMKHRFGEPLVAEFTRLLWQERRASLSQLGIDVVVPVPRHWTSRFRRSRNPPEIMGRLLATSLQARFSRHILRKVRRTPKQTSLPPTGRFANLKNAFRATRSNWIQDRTVLLVDDVLTTGSTANQSARALKKAGCQRVFVAVLARGIGR